MDDIRFDGQVAIVTGAGRGLGRAYALELATRGARVMVNNPVEADGRDVAEDVAGEIRRAGGEALASRASVTDEGAVSGMVDACISRWGGVDILIANAGILIDLPFAELTIAQIRAVIDVHLMGTIIPAKALWSHFIDRGYGRIVMTTSTSGVFGRATQTNYAAAKMGIIGFANALRNEGAAHGITVNTISPMARTRMTEELMAPDRLARVDTAHVSAGVCFLASRGAPNGVILTAGGGVFACCHMAEGAPVVLGTGNLTAEKVRDHWPDIASPGRLTGFENGAGHALRWFAAMDAADCGHPGHPGDTERRNGA